MSEEELLSSESSLDPSPVVSSSFSSPPIVIAKGSSNSSALRNKINCYTAAVFDCHWRASDETLFRVFNIASQIINNSWKNSKQKFTKFYDN